MRKILVLLIIAAVFCGCVSKPDKTVGKINGKYISLTAYNSAVKQQFELFKTKYDRSPNPEEMEGLKEKAWDRLITSVVLDEQFEKYNIKVTRSEAIDSLITHIPDDVSKMKIFMKDGELDREMYVNSVKFDDPVPMNWAREHYFFTYLPYLKLKNIVHKNRKIDEDMIKKEYEIIEGRANIEVIEVDPENFKKEAYVSQPDIMNYYEENKKDYFIPASCDLVVYEFPLQPSKADVKKAKVVADSIYYEIKRGKNYAYFYDYLAYHKIRWTKLDSLPSTVVKDLNQSNFKNPTKPYKRGNQWVILVPDTKKRNLLKMRELVIEPELSRETKKNVEEEVNSFKEIIKDIGLKNAIDEFNIKVHYADNLTFKNTKIPVIGESMSLVRKAVNQFEGTFFNPIWDNKASKYIIVQVRRAQKEEYESLMNKAEEIRTLLVDKKSKKLAEAKANELINNFSEETLSSKSDKYSTEQQFRFTPDTKIFGNFDSKMNRQILSYGKEGLIKKPFELNEKFYIVYINNYYPINYDSLKDKRFEIIAKLKSHGKDEYFDKWFESLKANAKIKDWRNANQMIQQ